jgi:hypothetical protein
MERGIPEGKEPVHVRRNSKRVISIDIRYSLSRFLFARLRHKPRIVHASLATQPTVFVTKFRPSSAQSHAQMAHHRMLENRSMLGSPKLQ